MTGYTSLSKCKENALTFAFKDLKPPKHPVLMQVQFNNEYGLSHFSMNGKLYSFYDEDEILLSDGTKYIVQDV